MASLRPSGLPGERAGEWVAHVAGVGVAVDRAAVAHRAAVVRCVGTRSTVASVHITRSRNGMPARGGPAGAGACTASRSRSTSPCPGRRRRRRAAAGLVVVGRLTTDDSVSGRYTTSSGGAGTSTGTCPSRSMPSVVGLRRRREEDPDRDVDRDGRRCFRGARSTRTARASGSGWAARRSYRRHRRRQLVDRC